MRETETTTTTDLRAAELITRVFNGVEIRQRKADKYLSGTDMCQTVGKFFWNYNENKTTKAFLDELEKGLRIPVSQLIESRKGNTSTFVQGTWVHPQVAMHLAQWCSPAFAVQVTKWLLELYETGRVELGPKRNPNSRFPYMTQEVIDQTRFQRAFLDTLYISRPQQETGLNTFLLETFDIDTSKF